MGNCLGKKDRPPPKSPPQVEKRIHHNLAVLTIAREGKHGHEGSVYNKQFIHLPTRPVSVDVEHYSVGQDLVVPIIPPHESKRAITPARGEASGLLALESPVQSMLYLAHQAYEARTPQDLSLQLGEHVRVLSQGRTQWWFVENMDGKSGYVPGDFLVVSDSLWRFLWFHGTLERLKAIHHLKEQVYGCFLIRESESNSGEYSLSVKDTDAVKHYRIRNQGTDYFISSHFMFPSLEALVGHYSLDSHGICCPLMTPCPRAKTLTADLDHTTAANWEVSRESLLFQHVLGHGEFGEVLYAKWQGLTPVAVKMLKPGTTNKIEFLKEASVMKKLQHDCLIRLYAVITTSEPMVIVTEFMSRGSLLDVLRSGYTVGDPTDHHFRRFVDMAGQVAEGMAYLESKNYIHRDLAARNVLVGDDYNCKVGDFGLARLVKSVYENRDGVYHPQSGAKFPVKWTAPEAIMFNSYTIKSDVWSFGILLMEMATSGTTPYPGLTNAEVVDAVIKGHRMSRPETCPQKLYEIMVECWNDDPDSRPSFELLFLRLCDQQFGAIRIAEAPATS